MSGSSPLLHPGGCWLYAPTMAHQALSWEGLNTLSCPTQGGSSGQPLPALSLRQTARGGATSEASPRARPMRPPAPPTSSPPLDLCKLPRLCWSRSNQHIAPGACFLGCLGSSGFAGNSPGQTGRDGLQQGEDRALRQTIRRAADKTPTPWGTSKIQKASKAPFY